MLDLVEKIIIGFCAFCAFLTLGLYLNIYSVFGLPTGVPSTESVEFLGAAQPARSTSPEGGATLPAAAPKALTQEDKVIAEKLRQQGRSLVGGQKIERKEQRVPSDLFEHIDNEANWSREVKKLQSKVIRAPGGNTRLQLYNIAENSLAKKLNLQENDVLELIDGEILVFDEQSAHEYFQRAKSLLQRVREGGSISITVTRNNRPVHLEFRLE